MGYLTHTNPLGLSNPDIDELRSNSLIKSKEIKSPAKAPESRRANPSLLKNGFFFLNLLGLLVKRMKRAGDR
jgi:hypothetical protein